MICNLSLFSCNKNTINTNSALNMKNAKTDLFLNSIKSRAMRSYLFFFFGLEFFQRFWISKNLNVFFCGAVESWFILRSALLLIAQRTGKLFLIFCLFAKKRLNERKKK